MIYNYLQFNCLIVFVQLRGCTLGAGLVDTKDTEWYTGTREQKTTTDKVHASSNIQHPGLVSTLYLGLFVTVRNTNQVTQ